MNPPLRLSGGELRRLLVLRERVRRDIVGAPRPVLRNVLSALEQSRQRRTTGGVRGRVPPEATLAELVREIRWRIDAAPLADAAAAAAVLDRAARRGRGRGASRGHR
jgi:hypothetical protein